MGGSPFRRRATRDKLIDVIEDRSKNENLHMRIPYKEGLSVIKNALRLPAGRGTQTMSRGPIFARSFKMQIMAPLWLFW